jgi:flagellar hook protein FlgE
MSLIRSLFSGVSGLKNHQVMMDVIGNNIANINTIGYKGSRITFSELFTQTMREGSAPTGVNGGVNPVQIGLGSSVGSVDANMKQGSFQTTDSTTDLAINNSGYFVVSKGGKNFYTRAGNFQKDGDGRLVNSTGAILQGKMADAFGVLPSGSILQNITIDSGMTSPPKATTKVVLQGNLDSSLSSTPAPGGSSTVNKILTVYDSLGNQHTIQLAFTRVAPDANNTWSYAATVIPATDTTAVTSGAAGTISFSSVDGKVTGAIATPLVLTPANGSAPMSITIDDGFGSLSAITQDKGDSSLYQYSQNGYAAGTLNGIEIGTDGIITGAFSNGQKLTLAQILLAQFNNPAGLERAGESLFDASSSSGLANITTASGVTEIRQGVLEQSNADLTDEFTNMIVAQRGFQANARVITTSDELLTELVNLKR